MADEEWEVEIRPSSRYYTEGELGDSPRRGGLASSIRPAWAIESDRPGSRRADASPEDRPLAGKIDGCMFHSSAGSLGEKSVTFSPALRDQL